MQTFNGMKQAVVARIVTTAIVTGCLMLTGCGGGGGSDGTSNIGASPPIENNPPLPPPPPSTNPIQSSSGSTVSDIEPNDASVQAQSVSLPVVVNGAVNSANDELDVFEFSPTTSGDVNIFLSAYGANDLDIRLYGANYDLLGSSLSPTADEELITFAVNVGEIYHISVEAFETGGLDSGYSLSVTIGASEQNTSPVQEPPPSAPPSDFMTFRITDGCNDGFVMQFKFYDVDNNLVWPSATSHYLTSGFDQTVSKNLACIPGAKICYGARTGNRFWGVDVDKSKGCDDCCYTCTQGASVGRRLVCS